MSPKQELKLRWEAMVNRVYWSLSLSGNSMTKAEIVKLLSSPGKKKKLNQNEQQVVDYKKGLDYISQNWLVNSNRVASKTIQTVHNLACQGRFRGSELELKQVLEYLQAGEQSPVIQAGVAQIQIFTLGSFTDGNGRTARLLANLFLYKAGYDFRGLLVLEEFFRRDTNAYKQVTESVIKNGNITVWLEYFAQGVMSQLEKAVDNLNLNRSGTGLPASFWNLNDRQKEILTILDQPDGTMTNKKVQREFKVSQITASRDLAKLATLGLLLAHGKGRSVYYTKV